MERPLFPRCLVESAGLGQELPSGKSLGLTKLEIQRELDLATVLAKILYERSQTFDNFEPKINLIHKDFLKIVSEF
jgi:hypothetical protein